MLILLCFYCTSLLAVMHNSLVSISKVKALLSRVGKPINCVYLEGVLSDMYSAHTHGLARGIPEEALSKLHHHYSVLFCFVYTNRRMVRWFCIA